MLIGKFEHSLDAKGRVTVPGRFREDLGERFVISKGMDGCLYLYPMEDLSPWTRSYSTGAAVLFRKVKQTPFGQQGRP